jgi:myo-inositol-1-phosphate synthase
MKKIILLGSLFTVLTAALLFSQTREEWRSLVNFDVTLEELSEMVDQPEVLEELADKILILRGVVGTRQVSVNDGENYQAELVIIAGKWIGLEEVRMYSVIAVLSGMEFVNHVPAGRTRNPDPDEVPLNSNVLVAGKLVGLADYEGRTVPVIDCYDIRVLN